MLDDRDYMHDKEGGQPGLSWLDFHGSAVRTLIVINVIVHILAVLSGYRLLGLICLHSGSVMHLQLWRLFTYMFGHGGWMHLLCNMYGLWIFGRGVEQLLGKRRFYQLYFFSGLIGGIIWTLTNLPSDSICVGASGSLFGVMGAAAMAFPNSIIGLLFPPVRMRLKTFVICYAALEVLMQMNPGDNIAHLAHLGGLLGAVIYMRRLRNGSQFSLWDWCGRQWRRFTSRSGRRGPDLHFPGGTNDAPSASIVDQVLEKMSTQGYESLTPSERGILEAASRNLKGKR